MSLVKCPDCSCFPVAIAFPAALYPPTSSSDATVSHRRQWLSLTAQDSIGIEEENNTRSSECVARQQLRSNKKNAQAGSNDSGSDPREAAFGPAFHTSPPFVYQKQPL